MNPFTRIVLTVIRLLGAGLLLVGGMNLGLYWFKTHHDKTNIQIWRCFYLSTPLLAGLLLLLKSSALARRLTQDFDE
jgi:type II secretory pathway component PulF